MITAKRYGPWAVVIGGSEAMGASFADKLAKARLNLVIVARKEGPLYEVAARIRSEHGVEVHALSLDLASDDMLERIQKETDDIDVGLVVYNAGAAHVTGGFLDQPLEDALRIVRVNSIGHLLLSHHFGKKMLARGRGGIILIGSMACVAGAAGVITYSAAKAFAQIFAEGLWAEINPHGVDVVYVPLGSFNTPSMARIGMVPQEELISAEDQVQQILDNIENGPVFVPPHLAEAFRQSRALPRREAAELWRKQMRARPGMIVPS
jgi:short-subunit dehydrogenase